MAMAKKAEAAVEVADAGLGVVQKAQAALIKKLQKALDDGASKADAKKIVGNAAGVDPKNPGTIAKIRAAENRLVDFVTRQQRTVKGQPFKKGKGGLGNRFQSPKDIRVKRGAARTIVYGGGATALGTAGNAAAAKKPTAEEVRDSAANPKGITAAEKARIMREAAAQLKKRKTDEIKGQDKANSKGKLFKKFRPFGGVIARALLGDDEKFGGERGMIDFIRLKKKKNKTPTEKEKMEVMMREEKKLRAAEKKAAAAVAKAKEKAKGLKNGGMAKKPVKKNMGGMMKKKGYANGGPVKDTSGKVDSPRYRKSGELAMKKLMKDLEARGEKKVPRKGPTRQDRLSNATTYKRPVKRTPPKINQPVDPSLNYPRKKPPVSTGTTPRRKRPSDAPGRELQRTGPAPKEMMTRTPPNRVVANSMAKKGYANGGMAKKGYANGGPAKKTTSKKTASRGKARGVGAATRGYGKAMR